MTITINGPDGTTIDFPDGTDAKTIDGVMWKSFAKPQGLAPKIGPAETLPDTGSFVGRGMTLGASDYVGGLGKYLGDKTVGMFTGQPSPSYEDSLKSFRQSVDDAREASPWASNIAELGGGIISPLFNTKGAGAFTPGKAMLGPGSFGPPINITGSIPGAVDQGMAALEQQIGKAFPKYGKLGIQGAAGGAAVGLGNARGEGGGIPTLGDIGQSMGTDATLGAGLGMGLPAAMEAGAAVGNASKDAFGGIIDRIPGNQDSAPGRRLARAVMRDNPGMSQEAAINAAEARLRLLGPQGTLADTGPNMLGVARSAAAQPGEALTASEQLPTRQYGQGERIQSAALRATGAAHKDELIARRAVTTGPLYEEAFTPHGGPVTANSPQISDPLIEDIFLQPESQAGLKEGMDSIRRDNLIARDRDPNVKAIDPNDYALKRNPETGQWEKVGTPNLRMIDALKRGYDILLDSDGPDMVNPRTGTPTNKARQIAEFRNILVNRTENQLPKDPRTITPDNPEGTSTWAYARNQWSQMSKPIEALNAIDKVVDKGYDASDLTNRINGSPALRAKIAGLTPDPQKMAEFTNELDNERTFAQTNRAVRGGSQTKYLQAAEADDSSDLPGALMHAAQGNHGSAIATIFRSLAKKLSGPPPGVSDALAPMFSNDPVQRQALIDLMRRRTQVGNLSGLPANLAGPLSRNPGAFVAPLTSGGSNQ